MYPSAVLAKVKGFDVFVSDMSLIKDAYKALLNKYETLLNKQVDKYQKMIDEQSKCQYYCRFANNKFLCYTHRCLYFFTKKWNSIKVFVEHYKWRRG